MKIRINHIAYSLLIPAFLVLSSCTGDFEDINKNPNAPEMVTPDLLLTGVERDMMGTVLGEAWGIGNTVMQHTAKNQFVNEDRYLWGELNSIWNAVYDNMRDVQTMIELGESGNELQYKGVGLVLRSWMFSLATDCYGEIPYTQAIQAKSSGIYYPQYDSQEEIYNGILADLEEANEVLKNAFNVKGDLIYGGDVKKWRKLANSLRVRYLMRISGRVDVSSRLQEIVSDPVNFPLLEGAAPLWNKDNATYTYLPTSPDQFPLYTARGGSFNEFRASKTMMDKLLALNDDRYKIFFRPTPDTESTPTTDDDEYVGLPNGLDDEGALEYNGGPQYQSRIGKFFYEDAVTTMGLQIAKGVVMTFAELQFLLAEAREKGLITSGDPSIYYSNGIQASFSYYGLSVPMGYMDQADVIYAGTKEEKLNKIGTQKWIAFYYQGLESWFDWRRTGYPELLPAVDNQNEDRIPVRFIYPIIEQSLNAKGRAAAVTRQGADNINTRVWWDVE